MSLPQISSTQAGSSPSPDVIADHIQRAGMGDLAAVLLQTFKPLAWVGGQMVWMLQPFVEGLGIGGRTSVSVTELAKLLESENGVDDIIARLRVLGDSKGEE